MFVRQKNRERVFDFFLVVILKKNFILLGKIPEDLLKEKGVQVKKLFWLQDSIDRPLRPLFPEGYRNDVQVIATALSVEQDNQPDVLAMIGSSVALTISDIPFNGPTGSC